jgi:hypothetical protein
MKTKAILATLLVAAAASVDARFASPFPRKAAPPDESGHWIVINANPWTHDMESGVTRGTLAVVRRVRVAAATGPDGPKSSPSKGKMPDVAERSPWGAALKASRKESSRFVKCRS